MIHMRTINTKLGGDVPARNAQAIYDKGVASGTKAGGLLNFMFDTNEPDMTAQIAAVTQLVALNHNKLLEIERRLDRFA